MGIVKKDRNQEIIARYIGGATIAILSDDFAVTRQRVQQILKRSGIQMRRRGKPRKARIQIECHGCGKSFDSLTTNRTFCSRKCAYRALRRYQTPKERAAAARAKKAAARERARRYYHEVFKARRNWKSIVRQRNLKSRTRDEYVRT